MTTTTVKLPNTDLLSSAEIKMILSGLSYALANIESINEVREEDGLPDYDEDTFSAAVVKIMNQYITITNV